MRKADLDTFEKPTDESITCLCCGMTSWNINDVFTLYCAYCHAFHREPFISPTISAN